LLKHWFIRIFKRYSEKDKLLITSIKNIVGYAPLNLDLFKLALIHSSAARENSDGFKESNERLEYLGDAILGVVVAEYLFKKFPYKDEGFLTEIRSRIVSRESLNNLARKIGLDDLVEFDTKRKTALSFKYLYGDAMEAFIGAVYLDRGFAFCRTFIIKKLIQTHLDMELIVTTDTNYKSKLIEWSQKNNKLVRFETLEEKGDNHQKQFKVQVLIDDVMVSRGIGYSKKKAEQDAARRACEELEIV
jgi:ribonuclease-3